MPYRRLFQAKICLGLLSGFILLKHTTFTSFSPRFPSNTYKKSCKISCIHYAPRIFHDLYRSDIQRFATHLPKIEDEKPDNSKSRVIANESESKGVKLVSSVAAVAAAIGLFYFFSQSVDLNALIQKSLSKVTEMGPYGYIYFAAVYILAEILAIPVVALTASSGYLFGLIPGTLLVLSCATVAASISFFIGRTFLRGWAQKMIAGSPKWRAIDKSIAREGFKVVLLLRLSPLLPFAISNYIYGVTSVDYLSFIVATFFGFAPGSFGVVYFGSAGKALMAEGGLSTSSMPWYGYLAIGGVVVLLGQAIAKFATDTIKQMEEEEANSTISTTETDLKEENNSDTMSDAPSWLTEENVNTASKAVKNPAVQKVAKKVVENPAVQKAVVAEVVKAASAPPAPASEAPGWVMNSNSPNANSDVEKGDSVSATNVQAVSDFPIEEETLKNIQKWHLGLRIAYMVAALLMGVLAGYSLVGQENLGLIFFAFYVMFFSILICCFELALSFVSRMIAMNFGFLYTFVGRFVFILFVGFMSFSLGLYGQIAMAVLYAALLLHLFIMYRFPRFEEYLRKKHFYEGRKN